MGKPHQNGWFDQEMKSMANITTPYDIKLTSLPSSSTASTVPKSEGNGITLGVWKWCEGWKCIDPEFKSNDSTNTNNSTLYQTEFVKLESLRYMNITPMPTINGMNPMRPSTSANSQQGQQGRPV